jgi:hypothetical protein
MFVRGFRLCGSGCRRLGASTAVVLTDNKTDDAAVLSQFIQIAAPKAVEVA